LLPSDKPSSSSAAGTCVMDLPSFFSRHNFLSGQVPPLRLRARASPGVFSGARVSLFFLRENWKVKYESVVDFLAGGPETDPPPFPIPLEKRTLSLGAIFIFLPSTVKKHNDGQASLYVVVVLSVPTYVGSAVDGPRAPLFSPSCRREEWEVAFPTYS